MMIFFLTFIFAGSIEDHPACSALSIDSIGCLKTCFGDKQNLLRACLDTTNTTEMSELFDAWKVAIAYYHATGRTTSSQANRWAVEATNSIKWGESAQYELFCALCCVEKSQRQKFLVSFKTFYNSICEATNTSASFLMLCAALEDNKDVTYAYLKEKFKATNNLDPVNFFEGFPVVDAEDFLDQLGSTAPLDFLRQPMTLPAHFQSALPLSAQFLMVQELKKEDFLIAHLKCLVAANSAQPALPQ